MAQSPPNRAKRRYDIYMKKETRLPLLTTDEMLALLASSKLVFTAAPEGTVSPTSEVRVTVHETPCFLG